jgi:hypothetical protein
VRRAEIDARLDELKQQLQGLSDGALPSSAGHAAASAACLRRARERALSAMLHAADGYDLAADAHDRAARVLERADAPARASAHRDAAAQDRSMAESQRRIAATMVE